MDLCSVYTLMESNYLSADGLANKVSENTFIGAVNNRRIIGLNG